MWRKLPNDWPVGEKPWRLSHITITSTLPMPRCATVFLVRRHKVAVTSQHFGVSPVMWATLLRERHRYDVVHAHGYGSAAPLAAALAGASPMIFTPHYHGTGHSLFRKALHVPYRAVGAGIVARSRRIICVSQAEADLFLAHFRGARERVRSFPMALTWTESGQLGPSQMREP